MPTWTRAQERAIYKPSGDGSILVSAAAGSGKTAVLVERIAEMILRDENPVSIDSLLVVTFTEAAAAEMKERIVTRLKKAQSEAIESRDTAKAAYLREQIHLTASADINTIDAFCLRVVRNNFHLLGTDPNFGIMDKSEGDMLIDDTLTELFDALYEDEENRERFLGLIKIYASNRDDDGLKSVIRKIYSFTQAFTEPMDWLSQKADMYAAEMSKSGWAEKIMLGAQREDIVKRNAPFWRSMRDDMLRLAGEYYGGADIKEVKDYWGKLWENVCKCAEATDALGGVSNWDEAYGFYKTYIEKKSYLGNAINKIPENIDAPAHVWQQYYGVYNDMRNDFRSDCMRLPVMTEEEFNSYVHGEELKRCMDDIVWLTMLFARRYEEKKAKRNVKTFADIEHLTCRLFAQNENIRSEYAQKYEEILIDEYQDTNGLQDEIFRLISRGGRNMFLVGDLKQSIYRFRGGDPTIFKAKSLLFADGNSDGEKISLSENFRSRMEIINGVNSVFEKVMSDAVGDVDYGDEEALCRSGERECYASDEELLSAANAEIGYKPELYRIASIPDEDGSEMSAARAEAYFIADKIRALVDGKYKVFAGGEYRDVEYGDIAVLVRSVKGIGEVLYDAMRERGIGAFVQKEEYFGRREIRLMMSLISVINNHRQDIPLIAVMRSPIGGFTETELAMIRANRKGGSYFDAVRSYSGDGTEHGERLCARCRRFTANLDRWRSYVKIKSIASLIWTLYEETGLYDFLGALEGGEEAQANLKLLYERAKKYEASGFKGIFNFIRYIERMEQRREDISGARLVNEKHNVVRIMTIHKSKGLEFPIVFVAGTTRKFSPVHPRDENRIALHKDFGIGIDYYNYEDMYHKKLIFGEYIKEENRKEYISEEMRLLYVAMTRAKEKLIVTAAKRYAGHEEFEAEKESFLNKSVRGALASGDAAKALSYSDWIIPAAFASGDVWKTDDIEQYGDKVSESLKREEDEYVLDEPDKIREAVTKILEYRYPYPESGKIPAKTSVTAIKEMADEENIRDDDPIYMVSKPSFLRDERRGAKIGTAHHQVMAYIDLDRMREIGEDEYEEFAAAEAERIASEGQIDRELLDDGEVAEQICRNVSAFFMSDMGKRVLSARRVYREKPFEIAVSARDFGGDARGVCESDEVVVQGIIDLFFEDENGDIVLVDYKTDRCATPEEKAKVGEKYRRQLELYERAMEKILKRKVKEKYLYLFSPQSVLQLK